ncbi:MAG: hypothetical protein P0Y50_06085 [Candidatus Brevundimonas colombiensis]|uniref:Uncharacterized protein n=1 Tax=Candidatus Brevundimonas colombiensis TaxID=3121376 RepID=A0AAJ5X307_9CAUL|nr:hypothetical protein [Brevundimonas sp.]WEK41157.1 MAG: hypothetical protein P0Y50_06005 [Brevundimonas sp.]WEK41173.1 MAG: hypothetical protein P0Y50_06085 [Brevundimonas sp.]
MRSAASGRIAATILPILTTDLPPLLSTDLEAALARASKKDQAKQELAARLGMPVRDILTREDVAAMMDPPTTTGWIEKNPDASPPFFNKGHGHIALYPRAWVEEHLRTGKVMDHGQRLLGSKPWPPAPPPPPPVDPVKRDNALAFLDKLGVKVDSKMKNQTQIKEIEDYRKGVSEGF